MEKFKKRWCPEMSWGLEIKTIPVSFSASSCHTVWWHFIVGVCVCPPSFPGCEFSIPSEAKGRERTEEREGE